MSDFEQFAHELRGLLDELRKALNLPAAAASDPDDSSRPHLTVAPDPGSDEWDRFVADHPELSRDAPLELDKASVLDALDEAILRTSQVFSRTWRGATHSSEVASVLRERQGGGTLTERGHRKGRVHGSRNDTLRVAAALRRLALESSAGVVRLELRNYGGLMWTTPIHRRRLTPELRWRLTTRRKPVNASDDDILAALMRAVRRPSSGPTGTAPFSTLMGELVGDNDRPRGATEQVSQALVRLRKSGRVRLVEVERSRYWEPRDA
jgi:hypothetical protein